MQLTAAIVAEHLEPILKQILVFVGVGALGCPSLEGKTTLFFASKLVLVEIRHIRQWHILGH